MCGICGEFIFKGGRATSGALHRMSQAIRHRGPDDSGEYVQGPIALGHRRLSIIDLSPLGRQPMWSGDGSHVITFNGEIYNYANIRGELERQGITFRGGSDTEVAVNAIACWGLDAALERFLGMFSLAVWNVHKHELTLCRDRVGVKPLYYMRDATGILFSSEPRALMAHPRFSRTINPSGLARYLELGYFPDNLTMFQGMAKLPPASVLTFDAQGRMDLRRYWTQEDLPHACFQGSFQDAQEELLTLLRDAFSLRLVSDVPVGHFLSGGVDSSLVAAVLRCELDVEIENFTVGFTGAHGSAYDETEAARLCSRKLGLPHRVRQVDAAEAQRALHGFCTVHDEPFADPSAIPTAILCAFAREHVKVALSADGGDEQFCGYTGYKRYPALYGTLSRIPLRRTLSRGAMQLPWERLLSLIPKSLGDARKPFRADRFAKLLELAAARDSGEVLDLYMRKAFSRASAARLLGLEAPEPSLAASMRQEPSDALTRLMMQLDYAYWLPEDILFKVDRTSMHVGLECRDPLLDHRIAAFARSLPPHYLQDASGQKRILRALLQRYVPELSHLPKKGFEIPLYDWLHGPWNALVKEHCSEERFRETNLLDPRQAHQAVRRFYAHPGRDPMQVWTLLILQLWATAWNS